MTAPAPARSLPTADDPYERAPRWAWLTLALLAAASLAGSVAVYARLRQVTSSADLKRATALTLHYTAKNLAMKSVRVDDPAQVRALLDALEITGTNYGYPWNNKGAARVDFDLPGGTTARCNFMTATHLERDGWGWVHTTPRFHQKLCEIVSQAEGRRIDVLNAAN